MNSILINFDNSADVNAAYTMIKKHYPTIKLTKTNVNWEELEDEYLLNLALERKKNDTGVRISFEEHLAKRGLTLEDLDKMEDVELEYELPNHTSLKSI